MDNKLSELSKPVAWVTMQREFCDDERSVITNEAEAEKYSLDCYDLTPLYSQEYVSALLAERDSWKRLADLRGENWEKDISNLLEARERIAELEQEERHSERQNVIDGLAGAGEAWSDIEEYMVKWDEGRRNAGSTC